MQATLDIQRAAAFWDGAASRRALAPSRTRWWEDETTRRHINRVVLGEDVDGASEGFHRRLSQFSQEHEIKRAVSVGCGQGMKEMHVLLTGAVSHFDLYEISSQSAAEGLEHAKKLGIADRLTFHVADAFTHCTEPEQYDLVYWNNALHHMPDVYDALRWSHRVLRTGGLIAMDDFVGPSRFQWSDENLRWANMTRAVMPERLLQNPWSPGMQVARSVDRPSVQSIVEIDPTEAMDSGRTVAALRDIFPEVEIIPTGGALYHLALNDVLTNFQSEDDIAYLRQILLCDQLLAECGTTHYAVAFARKAARS